MMRKAGREAAWFSLFLAIAVVATWPLAARIGTAVSDLGDPLLNSWILDWTSHALLHHPLRLFNPPVFHPSLYPLAFSEHLVGIALLTLPFHAAGLPPVTVYNIAMLLAFALSGYGGFVLARMFVVSRIAALAGGIFFAFVPLKFDHLAHLQVVSAGWIPLVLAAFIAYWRNPSRKNGALFAAAFVMNGLTNVYFLLFVSAAIGVSMLFLIAAAPRRDRRFWMQLLASLALAGLVLLPFLLPYKIVSDEYRMKRSEDELVAGSPRAVAWLAATGRSSLYGDVTPERWRRHEQMLFPGVVAPLLAGVAIFAIRRRPRGELATASPAARYRFRWLDVLLVIAALFTLLALMMDRVTLRVAGHLIFAMRGTDIPLTILLVGLMFRLPLRSQIARMRVTIEEWVAAVWIVVGFLGSLGMNTFFFSFLFRRLEVFESIRAPGRFAVIAYAGLIVWAAVGAAFLLRRRPRTVGAFLLALLLFELRPLVRWDHAPEAVAPLYRWMAETKIEPTLELPLHGWWEAGYLLGNSHHRLLSMNGTSGWEPPFHRELRIAWESKEYLQLLSQAGAAGCRLLVIHAHLLEEQSIRAFLRGAVDDGSLGYLGRFDHGTEGDFAFAVTENLPDWKQYREAEIPNGAGHLPEETLSRFLAGEPTHSTAPFGAVERPVLDEQVKGPLKVEGWTIAPGFTREVWVLLDSGRLRYQAQRIPRSEISGRYPWYYNSEPGFVLDLPQRPSGVPRSTDLQIEVVEENGRKTRLETVFFEWD